MTKYVIELPVLIKIPFVIGTALKSIIKSRKITVENAVKAFKYIIPVYHFRALATSSGYCNLTFSATSGRERSLALDLEPTLLCECAPLLSRLLLVASKLVIWMSPALSLNEASFRPLELLNCSLSC